MNQTLQYTIVGLVVLWAAWNAFGKFFPAARRAVQNGVALRLVHPGRAAWMRRIGLRLLAAAPTAAGCGNGCGKCDGCGVAPVSAKPSSANSR
jgi:hypothetical protein